MMKWTVFWDDEQGKGYRYVDDCVVFSESDTSLPFEWECSGVRIGVGSYFGESYVKGCQYGHIERIGNYTSISSSAVIQKNHQLNMIFTSDDLQDIITDDNAGALFPPELFMEKFGKTK